MSTVRELLERHAAEARELSASKAREAHGLRPALAAAAKPLAKMTDRENALIRELEKLRVEMVAVRQKYDRIDEEIKAHEQEATAAAVVADAVETLRAQHHEHPTPEAALAAANGLATEGGELVASGGPDETAPHPLPQPGTAQAEQSGLYQVPPPGAVWDADLAAWVCGAPPDEPGGRVVDGRPVCGEPVAHDRPCPVHGMHGVYDGPPPGDPLHRLARAAQEEVTGR